MVLTEVFMPRSLQLWRALIDWLGFFLQIILQFLNGTPFLSHIMSFIGLGHRSLIEAPSSSPTSFSPLPVVELPLQDFTLMPAPALASINVTEEDEDNDEHHISKLTVVLDLDETLICAYETSTLPAMVRNQAIEAGLKCFELEVVSSFKDCDRKPRINYVTVFERPGLAEFLKQIGEFADLVLFTAGLEGYARPLVDRIDVENLFSLRLYRQSTINTEYREFVKDLSHLSKDLRRLVIVDNNPFSFMLQPSNGIPCISFSAGQPCDNQLLEVLLPLLKHLSLQKDVRPVLQERFHMPEWFQMHGIPASG